MVENKEFMQSWHETGRDNWKVNQMQRTAQIDKDVYFENREIKIYKDKLNKELNEKTKDL